MTLRHRLLLVYGIVILLSIATMSMAMFESMHARQIIRELQDWNGIVLNVEKLKSSWPPPARTDEFDLRQLLAEQFLSLANAPDYLDKKRVLEALYRVYRQYDIWKNQSAEMQSSSLDTVRKAVDQLAIVVGLELTKLNNEADRQASRTRILLYMVAGLTILHVAVIGSLLRRWLLQPMEQLNRQVEALGRNQPPQEPLLKSPQEMASLADALDKARRSLDGLRQKLIQSERLTTMGQLSAQLAHNLRNPLASIRAAAQITLRHTGDDDAARIRMQDIMASVDRLDRWIAGLMEIAQRDRTPTQALDVVPTLHRVRDALTSEVQAKEMTLEIEAPADGLVCAYDPVTLEHALVAMIVNAIEASPLGGHITVRAEKIAPNGRPGAICRISVIDEGMGLPTDAPERIFEFAYSTKQKGMGLGLALARQTLQRQGGSAHARNNPTRGATVYVELPIETVGSPISC